MSFNVGRVSKYLYDRGFGFIQPEDEETDIFFHRTSVKGFIDGLQPDQIVLYVVGDRKDRPGKIQAAKVRIISDEILASLREGVLIYGKVSFWSPNGSYGFISALDNSAASLFVHINSTVAGEQLKPGQFVSFQVVERNEKLSAETVSVVSEETAARLRASEVETILEPLAFYKK